MEFLLSVCIEKAMQVECMIVNGLRISYSCDCSELQGFGRRKVDIYENSGIRLAL